MPMIVRSANSTSDSVQMLERYLYESKESNYELLEIFEEIDKDVSELENIEYDAKSVAGEMESELDELKSELKLLLGDWKILEKGELKEELERILF